MSHHDDLPYLKHIMDSIGDIGVSVMGMSKEQFKNNKDVKDATIRRIEIIGEAAKNISKGLKENHPDIKWSKIAGARDMMIDAYFNVDLDIVWNIIQKDVPTLKEKIYKKVYKQKFT